MHSQCHSLHVCIHTLESSSSVLILSSSGKAILHFLALTHSYTKQQSLPQTICHHNTNDRYQFILVRGGADKSLALPGRKQATATKLGIYSTYSARSSIHFLAPCSNFCKPLKKIQRGVHPIRSLRQQ